MQHTAEFDERIWIGRITGQKHADSAGLLRLRRERSCCRAAEQRHELAPFHLTEMHPIPSRVRSTSQAYRIAANQSARIAPDQSAGMEGDS
jgi:hypothetical protein